jgi:hypothetical protein
MTWTMPDGEREAIAEIRYHEHFCSVCFSRNGRTNGQAKGWYRCGLKPCTKLPDWKCPKHREAQP